MEKERTVTLRGDGKAVCIVDDEEMIRELSFEMCQSLGFTPHTFRTGTELCEFIDSAATPPACVFYDMIMPEEGALEMYAPLRKRLPHTPIVIMSGFPKNRDVDMLLAQGADGFMEKPFDLHRLAEVLETIPRLDRSGPDASS